MAVWSITNTFMALAAFVAGFIYLFKYRSFQNYNRLLMPATLAFIFCGISLIAASVNPSSQRSFFRIIEHVSLAAAALAFAWQMLSARIFRKQS